MKNFLCVQLWATWTATFYFYFGKKLIYFSEGSTLPQCLKMSLKVIWIFAPKKSLESTRIVLRILSWNETLLGDFQTVCNGKVLLLQMHELKRGEKKCWNLFLIFQCKVGVKRLKKNFTWKFTPIVLFFNTRVEITTVEYAHLHLVVYETWKSL